MDVTSSRTGISQQHVHRRALALSCEVDGGRPLARAKSPPPSRGDRSASYRANGRVATARTGPGLLGHRARDASGEPPWRRPWTGPAPRTGAACRTRPTLARDEDATGSNPSAPRRDRGPSTYSGETPSSRPNIVIGGVESLPSGWTGRELRIGDVRIGISLRGRA